MRASDLPLSVLIVGVGGADFQQMEVYTCFIYQIPNVNYYFLSVLRYKTDFSRMLKFSFLKDPFESWVV